MTREMISESERSLILAILRGALRRGRPGAIFNCIVRSNYPQLATDREGGPCGALPIISPLGGPVAQRPVSLSMLTVVCVFVCLVVCLFW